jgi:hypothetical protein
MAWDIQLDHETGDIVFNGTRDLAPVVGSEILRQRISTRLKVEYGSFMFDRTLGSRIRGLLGSGVPRTQQNLKSIIMDALEPMDDITVLDVIISYPDSRTVAASILYQYNNNTNLYSPTMTPQAQTTVLLPA